MKDVIAVSGLAALLVLAAGMTSGGQMTAQGGNPLEVSDSPTRTADLIIEDWPKISRLVARTMIDQYGPPDGISDDALTWRNNGPWKRTVVYRASPEGSAMSGDADVLQQVVSYHVPLARFEELTRFDQRVVADRARDELFVRSDSEKLNFLLLNLADEIIVGWKDVAQARRDYDNIYALTYAGKSSPYTEGFRFKQD